MVEFGPETPPIDSFGCALSHGGIRIGKILTDFEQWPFFKFQPQIAENQSGGDGNIRIN